MKPSRKGENTNTSMNVDDPVQCRQVYSQLLSIIWQPNNDPADLFAPVSVHAAKF